MSTYHVGDDQLLAIRKLLERVVALLEDKKKPVQERWPELDELTDLAMEMSANWSKGMGVRVANALCRARCFGSDPKPMPEALSLENLRHTRECGELTIKLIYATLAEWRRRQETKDAPAPHE